MAKQENKIAVVISNVRVKGFVVRENGIKNMFDFNKEVISANTMYQIFKDIEKIYKEKK